MICIQNKMTTLIVLNLHDFWKYVEDSCDDYAVHDDYNEYDENYYHDDYNKYDDNDNHDDYQDFWKCVEEGPGMRILRCSDGVNCMVCDR